MLCYSTAFGLQGGPGRDAGLQGPLQSEQGGLQGEKDGLQGQLQSEPQGSLAAAAAAAAAGMELTLTLTQS